ncbi:ABC transporter permease [Sulfurimonas sp. SAG-AH-194-C21]|nr:ABC transporter permease [Sulfurimonas sp. SAG-AH-194-C21]MDF1883374.1 ABC transporter permease [Sulfurimonas sp. SAG-AH-194-C21]
MLKVLNSALIQELREIKNSWYKLFLITLFPILSFALLVSIFYSGVATKLPIVVVDNDKSDFSSRLLFNISASPSLNIKYKVLNTKEAINLVKSTDAYALIEIPKGFQKDTLLGLQPQVTLMLNTQFVLIGKMIKASVFEIVATSSAQIEYVKSLVQTQNTQLSLKKIAPISLQLTPFYNTYKNYFLFLISALLPAVWQIFIVVTTIVSFGTLFKAKKEKDFFDKEYLFMSILGKLLPYTIAYTLLGMFMLFYIYGTQAWVFQGSFSIMLLAVLLTVIAYQAITLLFFVSGFDYARTLSLGAVFTAPAFAFLGVTFPISSMNSFALFWRDLLPIAHYIEIQISQSNYGRDVFMEIEQLLYLGAFSLVFIPVYFRFKKRLIS